MPGTFFPIGVGNIPAGTAERPVDPINVFPLVPANNQARLNNYTPMWDARVATNGPSDGFIAGLNSAEAIINCPVIAQPLFSPQVGPGVPSHAP